MYYYIVIGLMYVFRTYVPLNISIFIVLSEYLHILYYYYYVLVVLNHRDLSIEVSEQKKVQWKISFPPTFLAKIFFCSDEPNQYKPESFLVHNFIKE